MTIIDNLVIGSTVAAIEFAALNKYSIIQTTPLQYLSFDQKIESKISLMFELYLKGDVVNHLPTDKVIIRDNVLSFFDGYLKKEIKFKNIYVYDFVNIDCEGFELLEEENIFRVVDWVSFKTGGIHKHDYLYIGDEILYEVYFYLSKRIQFKKFKDAIAISYMTPKQLKDPNYSDSLVKLKLQQVLKERGFKGKINNYVGDKVYHLKPKFEIAKRDVIKISNYKIKTPKNIFYHNSFKKEVINERTEAFLKQKGLSSGGDSSNCQATI